MSIKNYFIPFIIQLAIVTAVAVMCSQKEAGEAEPQEWGVFPVTLTAQPVRKAEAKFFLASNFYQR